MTDIKITIVETMNEWIQCQQIRSTAFLPTESYHEEFDNRDFELVTHLLGLNGKTPIACMRLRYFSSETIHWGRLALMPNLMSKHRLKTLHAITNFAAFYSENMGFKRIIGEVSDERLIKFWKKRGFNLTGEAPKIFGGREYWPFEKYLD
ncbi:hypothetical protein [Kiloniella majae]|uniref:hypothetical protein n=1 Tax=Kiloniella majae TaxID=1938558 RepID=UPI000A2793E4|nr:hypothetical protein [Kiloniella majae]